MKELSPRDRGQIAIKLGTKHVIYQKVPSSTCKSVT